MKKIIHTCIFSRTSTGNPSETRDKRMTSHLMGTWSGLKLTQSLKHGTGFLLRHGLLLYHKLFQINMGEHGSVPQVLNRCLLLLIQFLLWNLTSSRQTKYTHQVLFFPYLPDFLEKTPSVLPCKVIQIFVWYRRESIRDDRESEERIKNCGKPDKHNHHIHTLHRLPPEKETNICQSRRHEGGHLLKQSFSSKSHRNSSTTKAVENQ